jgi:hypothetical protein
MRDATARDWLSQKRVLICLLIDDVTISVGSNVYEKA